jgi:nitrogen regulatory protein P-II 1
MHYHKVTAIICDDMLSKVEEALVNMQVGGMSVSQVSGYGEYHDFYKRDMMSRHIRLEVFCSSTQSEAIAQCIMTTAHTGEVGDGVVAITAVEQLYRIRTLAPLDN